MLQAFVDDSGSDRQGPVYLLAGYVSDVDSWVSFAREWQEALHEPPRISSFKMSEAESLKGEFAGWTRVDADAKVHELIPIVCKHARSRIECIFWQQHYETEIQWFIPKIRRQLSRLDGSRIEKLFRDPYFLAFFLIMTDYAKRLATERSNEFVDFIFDSQGKIGKKSVEWWRE